MKSCKGCAELIQDAATICRFCGTEQRSPRKSLGCGSATLIILAAIFAFVYFLPETPDQKAEKSARASAPVNDPVKCERVLSIALKNGTIRQRPEANRVNVDELRWTLMPASEKSVLMQMLLCSAFNGRSMAQVEPMDYVVVYGWRSGKRLALLGSAGLKFE
jgi:hypothetical protein